MMLRSDDHVTRVFLGSQWLGQWVALVGVQPLSFLCEKVDVCFGSMHRNDLSLHVKVQNSSYCNVPLV